MTPLVLPRPSLHLLTLTLAVAACANGGSASSASGGSVGGTDGSTDSNGITETDGNGDGDGGELCLAHNCNSDEDCLGCSEGRTQCWPDDKRCVACDPGTGAGCPADEMCTEFGACVPLGATCPETCNDDPDCAPCDPLHQVCDAGQCVACRGDATEACQGTEFCSDNACVAKCPADCFTDSDCAQCGADTERPATACYRHRCAECSDTVLCPQGSTCSSEGVCMPSCGLPGPVTGICNTDGDCAGCQGDNDHCNAPINGGHGECGPSASGCSDLGDGVVVLPSPFDQVTNLCSNEDDCANVGVTYNVGQLLRDLTGIDAIDDANIIYPMHECGAVTVGIGGASVSCGVCVPCREDNDCLDINIEDVADDAFGGIGGTAASLLLDQLFGQNDHLIHMFCQPVAGDYGVCVPCPTLINDCAAAGSGSGMCDHDTCTLGGPLDPTCGGCAAAVCAEDDYCCATEWDDTCIEEVGDFCAASCDGGTSNCHDPCMAGVAMNASCGTCASQICADDPYCCQVEWDESCADAVATTCDDQCGATCGHEPCDQGGPLLTSCSSCAAMVCADDDYCCTVDWDSACVDSAAMLCGCTAGACAHNECQSGAPLDASCSPCATAVCNDDALCCTEEWDFICTAAAQNLTACSC